MADPMITKCPSCQQSLQVPPEMFGGQVSCPFCKQQFSVQGGGSASEAPGAASAFGSPASLSMPAPQPITNRMAQLLGATRPWVLFLSILGFIACGLMALGGLVIVLVGSFTSRSGLPAFLGLIYIPLAVVYFFPAHFLLKYSGHIRQFLATGSAMDMESALASQKSFWRFTGILAVVLLCVYAIILLVAVAFGVFAQTRSHGF